MLVCHFLRAVEYPGWRWRGSSAGSGRLTTWDRDPVRSMTIIGELAHREFSRIAEIDRAGKGVIGCHQANDAVDQIVDVAKRTGLVAVAIERDRLAESAWMMKLETTRPSAGCMRGP